MRWRAWLFALAVARAASADPEHVWLARADGCRQCEPCRAPALREVVAELERRGVRVERAVEHAVPVCDACLVCVSGRQFAVRIGRAQVEALERLGWSKMIEPPTASELRE